MSKSDLKNNDVFDFNGNDEIIHKNCNKRIEDCKCKNANVEIVKKDINGRGIEFREKQD